MRPVIVIAFVLAACVFAGAFGEDRPTPPPTASNPSPLRTPYGAGPAPFAQLPATSCAAASCHGGGHVGKAGSEHTTWAPEADPQGPTDPHAKAYRVLFNSVSINMAKALGLGDAHTAALCLKCHAVDGTADPETRDGVLSEGASCGACHGPAEKWNAVHYTPAWKALTAREKWEKYGFVPANNLVARALNCASCHVGDADREVNHDLYAAGHPRVTFEAARMHYHEDYRKHWVEKTPQPDFEVRTWVVGQAATLRAATELLRVRAERAADPAGIWPEFSGYSCYSCHQRVGEGGVRNELSAAARPLGVPGWEVWSTTAVGVAAEYSGAAYPGVGAPDLRETRALQKLMAEKRTPNAKAVAAQAGKAVLEQDAWLVALQDADDRPAGPVAPGTAGRLGRAVAANAVTPDGRLLRDHDWDALAVNYLGCAAMFHAAGGDRANPWGAELRAVRDELRFPPRGVTRFDSPYDYTRTKLGQLKANFERLRDAAAPTGGK